MVHHVTPSHTYTYYPQSIAIEESDIVIEKRAGTGRNTHNPSSGKLQAITSTGRKRGARKAA
eukprot:scaffold250_cov110-Isochrysis_galbana.AAC.17